MITEWLKYFCTHRKLGYMRDKYGDEIIEWGGRRSILQCKSCGKLVAKVVGTVNETQHESIETKAKLARLQTAWTEFQKFGTHDGPCDFTGVCSECGTHQGRCTLHANAMKERTELLNPAINSLIDHCS
jgi:hypothetical protein